MLRYWWQTSPCWITLCQSIKVWKPLPGLLSLTVKQSDAKSQEQPALFMLNPSVVRTVPVRAEFIGQLTFYPDVVNQRVDFIVE